MENDIKVVSTLSENQYVSRKPFQTLESAMKAAQKRGSNVVLCEPENYFCKAAYYVVFSRDGLTNG